jgi:hypothetical protein
VHPVEEYYDGGEETDEVVSQFIENGSEAINEVI